MGHPPGRPGPVHPALEARVGPPPRGVNGFGEGTARLRDSLGDNTPSDRGRWPLAGPAKIR